MRNRLGSACGERPFNIIKGSISVNNLHQGRKLSFVAEKFSNSIISVSPGLEYFLKDWISVGLSFSYNMLREGKTKIWTGTNS